MEGVVRKGGSRGATVLTSLAAKLSCGSRLAPAPGVVRCGCRLALAPGVVRCSGMRGWIVVSSRGSKLSAVSPLPLGEGAVEEEKKTVVSSSLNLKRRKKVNALADPSLTDPIEMLFTNKLIYKKSRRPALNKQFINM